MVGILVAFWEDPFSGAIVVLGKDREGIILDPFDPTLFIWPWQLGTLQMAHDATSKSFLCGSSQP